MTVSSSVGRRLTIERIVLLAYQGIGLVNIEQGTSDSTWPKKFLFGRDMLELIVNDLSGRGISARARELYKLNITAADVAEKKFQFTLPGTILDLLLPAVFIRSSEVDVDRADGETFMRIVTVEEWQQIASKSATSAPTIVWPDRSGDQIIANLWPIPDDPGTVRFLTQRKLADCDDGNATLDLEEFWTNYVVTQLQSKLASAHSLPSDVVQMQEMKATELLGYARGKAGQQGIRQAILSHPTAAAYRGRY